MKLNDIKEAANTLEEGMFQRAAAAAAIVIGAITAGTSYYSNTDEPDRTSVVGKVDHTGEVPDTRKRSKAKVDPVKLTQAASAKYRVDPGLVRQIVDASIKYQDDVFPTAKDILSVIGTESSFNPDAVSQLKRDPAVGLMQVRPGVWGIDMSELKTIDGQIKHGARILALYYKKFGNREAALHAYNVGETRHRASIKNPEKANPRYVPKINAAGEIF